MKMYCDYFLLFFVGVGDDLSSLETSLQTSNNLICRRKVAKCRFTITETQFQILIAV